MKWIKLYEDFQYEDEVVDTEIEIEKEVSDKTINDVLKSDFFEDRDDVFRDERGVYHISGWNVY